MAGIRIKRTLKPGEEKTITTQEAPEQEPEVGWFDRLDDVLIPLRKRLRAQSNMILDELDPELKSFDRHISIDLDEGLPRSLRLWLLHEGTAERHGGEDDFLALFEGVNEATLEFDDDTSADTLVDIYAGSGFETLVGSAEWDGFFSDEL